MKLNHLATLEAIKQHYTTLITFRIVEANRAGTEEKAYFFIPYDSQYFVQERWLQVPPTPERFAAFTIIKHGANQWQVEAKGEIKGYFVKNDSKTMTYGFPQPNIGRCLAVHAGVLLWGDLYVKFGGDIADYILKE